MKDILNIEPGDMRNIFFPKDFTIDYQRFGSEPKFNVPVRRMRVYYWDEDDHFGVDYYFYNDDSNGWFAKFYDLTKESKEKVRRFVQRMYKNKRR